LPEVATNKLVLELLAAGRSRRSFGSAPVMTLISRALHARSGPAGGQPADMVIEWIRSPNKSREARRSARAQCRK
jgi:hypothetical protein